VKEAENKDGKNAVKCLSLAIVFTW